jgi:hypothetical protein
MSFIKRGYEAFEQKEQEFAERMAEAGKPWRFWMKPGAETNIVFLDDNPPIIEEHQLKIDGKWQNWFTCLRAPELGGKCPLCASGDKPYTVGFYTILDRTKFTRKDKSTGQDQIRVLGVKFKSLKALKKYSVKLGGLAGQEFNVERSNSGQSASTGDVLVPQGQLTESQLLDLINKQRKTPVESLDAVLINWEEYLAPQSAEDLAKLVGKAQASAEEAEEEVVRYN